MGFKGTVRVFEINKTGAPQPETPLFTITNNGSKPTVAAWTALDQYIVTGHENGTLNLWDMVSPALLLPLGMRTDVLVTSQEGELFCDKEERAHSEPITDLQMSPDGTWFVTSSKDKSAKVISSASSCRRHWRLTGDSVRRSGRLGRTSLHRDTRTT